MAHVDFSKCDMPDELIQLAWNAGIDKKALIRAGSDSARLLLSRGERTEMIELFWPFPSRLEAVDRWSENKRLVGDTSSGRPFASAVVPGCVVGGLVSHFVIARHMSKASAPWVMLLAVIASIAVLGVVFKALIGMSLRRQAAQLDEERALAIVLEQLRTGMARRPAAVPLALKWIRESPGVDSPKTN